MDDGDRGGLLGRWDRCWADPECRARAMRALVRVSVLYTALGFLIIILIVGGLLEF